MTFSAQVQARMINSDMRNTMKDESLKEIQNDVPVESNRSTSSAFFLQYKVELSPLEGSVLLIAKELIEKHYLLNAQDLYLQAVRRFKEGTPISIKETIEALISKRILFDGSSITRDEVLKNETRVKIFQLIFEKPGIHISAIRALLAKDSRSVLYHLKILERYGFVRSEQINNNTAYYEFNSSKEFDTIHYYFQKDKASTIFFAIFENPSISFEDLSVILKESISSQTLLRKVKILLENKLLTGKFESSQIIALDIPVKYRSFVKTLSSYK